MTVPNIISAVRILLIPVFSYCFLAEQYLISGFILAFSGLSDLVDGYIARHFNQESDIGKLLDPVADKLTLAAVLACMWVKLHDKFFFVTPIFAVMFLKEVIMAIGGIVLVRKGRAIVKAQWWGKVATVGFYVLMTATIVVYALCDESVKAPIIANLTISAAALTVFALVRYFVIGVRSLKGETFDESQIVDMGKIGKKQV
ncbi:MAG: CDP-alcohol phosphatidyltransferase family protein [Oscillospiraceae bacterium]|nr:CDP-alcohol phosphatidyltransferase family protein [Oscillospiraceae bacterium]